MYLVVFSSGQSVESRMCTELADERMDAYVAWLLDFRDPTPGQGERLLHAV